MAEKIKRSIRDFPPLETGGVIARQGFVYQDHIAASFCLEMIESSTITEVWCESLDDITLIHSTDCGESVEFIQVKRTQIEQLWTIAKLCEKDAKSNKSIIHKLLDNDRGLEKSSFRLVTSRPVKSELNILCLPFDSTDRTEEKLKKLSKEITNKLNDYHSPNGNDWHFWVSTTIWEIRQSEDDVQNSNLLELSKIIENRFGNNLATDQNEELYNKLLKKVQDAGVTDSKVEREKKKIYKKDLINWLQQKVEESINPIRQNGKTPLESKMIEARIPSDYISNAIQQRAAFRRKQLDPKYFSTEDNSKISLEVAAKMARIRSALDAGEMDNDGLTFHGKCLFELEELRASGNLPPNISSSYLQGSMYELTNRCLHRFLRVEA